MVVKHSKLTQLPPNTKQDRKQGRQAGSKPGQSQSPSVLATTVTPNQNAPDKPSKREIQFKNLKDPRCPVCTGHHGLENCSDFGKKSVSERAAIVKEHGCCLRCLVRGHHSKDCLSSKKCGVEKCKYRHHTLIHGAPRLFEKSAESKNHQTHQTGKDTICKYTFRPVVKLCLLEEAAPEDSDSKNGVSVSRNRAGDVDDGTGFPSLPTKEKRP